RRRARGPALPAQDDKTSWQWTATPDNSAVFVGAAFYVSAREGGEAKRRLPLHLHRQGGDAGDHYDPGRHLASTGRSSGRGRPARDRRQRNVARLHSEGTEPSVGVSPEEDSHERVAEVADRLREM